MSAELDMLSQEEIEAVAVFLIRELESTDKSHSFGESFETPEHKQPFEQVVDDYQTESLTYAEKDLIREVVRSMYAEKAIIREAVQEVYTEKENDGVLHGIPSSEMEFLAPFLPQREGGGHEAKQTRLSDSYETGSQEKRQQALPDYSEITHESGVDMSRVSRYFDRDSRRYDSAFERY